MSSGKLTIYDHTSKDGASLCFGGIPLNKCFTSTYQGITGCFVKISTGRMLGFIQDDEGNYIKLFPMVDSQMVNVDRYVNVEVTISQ